MPSPLPILIIEDDPVIGRALCRALEQAQQQYDCVGSCAEALALAGPYCAAIIDIHLPDGNGLDLYEDLYAYHVLGAVVFFSATAVAQEQERASELGALVHKSAGVELAVDTALRLALDYDVPESSTRASTPELPCATSTDSAHRK
ncbi:MAG TPA: response regulator [Polyangiaceae bacterium]|nr:response regulator [Polyangiaceae bacterium]